MKYVDLSREFSESVPVYPGDSHPVVKELANVDRDGLQMFEVTSGMHVGTHMDAPLHFVSGGARISEIAIEKFFCRGVVIDARGLTIITDDVLRDVVIGKGDCVLVYSGWSTRFGKENYFTEYPTLSEAFATQVIEAGVSMVGVDMPSPDREPFLTHKVLLESGVLILENLVSVEKLLGIGEFQIVALPVKYATEAAPVRVVAMY
jgi:kynurenine formamidase